MRVIARSLNKIIQTPSALHEGMKILFGLRANILFAVVLITPLVALRAAAAPPLVYQGIWTAQWIAVPHAPAFDYGVYHFRRSFDLETLPAKFIIHISADNRYQLFVNGVRVSWGPARGDLNHWRYETVDIAPHLRAGKNTLAAVVWNFSDLAPEAQLTYRTGFLLQGNTKFEQPLVDTSAAWKCVRNIAYSPRVVEPKEILYQYMVVGPGDAVDAAKYPWDGRGLDFDDSSWKPAREIGMASGRESRLPHATRWFLVPRTIPPMEEHPERLSRVRRSEGVTATDDFLKGASSLVVKANSRARLLLDQDRLTTAYPELVTSGGRGASLRIRYAENLWTPSKMEKSHRNQIEGKEFRGNEDFYVTDGGARRSFRPLWWRCYRYIELDIETKGEPLTINDIRATHVSFPFVQKARFASDTPELERIIETGWRTLRLGAHETYQDSPYYEQMQYVGDTRIEALVSYYMAGDDRLARNAIELFNDSRTAEGLTMSRAPSRFPQYIPTFSLIWIGMVHDWWRYRDDAEFARRMLPGVRGVLQFFAERQKPDGSLGEIPFWVFVDWVKEFPTGAPPGWNYNSSWNSNADTETGNSLKTRVAPDNPNGASSILDLQLALAYSWAADLENALGSQSQADEYRTQARRIRVNAQRLYWSAERQMYSDTPAHTSFSQHANVLAILNDMLSELMLKR
jgi:hypothetical protein